MRGEILLLRPSRLVPDGLRHGFAGCAETPIIRSSEEQTIIPKTTRITLYGDASYKFSDAVEVYGEFLANRRKTYQNGWRQFWTFGGNRRLLGTYWAQGWEG